MFKTDNFKNEILKSFKQRVLNFDNRLELFFTESIKNIIKNSEKLHELINKTHSSNKEVASIEKPKKEVISDYIQQVKKHDVNQKNIISLIKKGTDYYAYLEKNQMIKLNSDELSLILQKNTFQNDRYVILDTNEHLNDKTFIKDFQLDGTNKGKVIYSQGISYDVDNINKEINIKQTSPNDWIFFINISFSNWSVNFDGKLNVSNNQNTTSQRLNSNGLTGCLNFLYSFFENSSINTNNGGCEDSVNIIDSRGSIKFANISDSFSDGLDIDFSKISIDKLFVNNSGNDCFDVSGGNYKITFASLTGCKDKALSIGEASELNGNEIQVYDSNIGISVKDHSKSTIKNFTAKKVDICAEALQKKQEFGGAIANFNLLKCRGLFNSDKNSFINKNFDEL